MLLVTAGCGSYNSTYYGNITYNWQENLKSYNAIVKDNNNKEIIRIECEYIGNKPKGKIKGGINRDYKKNHVDFYNYKIFNLTKENIKLKKVKYRFDKGQYKKVFSIKNENEISEDLNGNIIFSNSFLERKNSWVWGKFNPDVLHKIYTAETDSGYIFEIDIHLKYQK